MVLQQATKSSNSKVWLIAAMLFVIVGGAGFGFYSGYLPMPGAADGEPTTAFVDEKLLVAGNQAEDKSLNSKENRLTADSSINTSQESNAEDTSNSLQETSLAAQTNEKASAANGDSQNLETTESMNGFQDTSIDNLLVAQAEDQKLVSKDPSNQESTKNLEQAAELLVSKTKTAELDQLAYVDSNKIKTSVNEVVTQQKIAKPLIQKPKPIALNKGVVVLAFGDPAIANPVEKILEGQLKQQGIKVMNEQFIPGMKQLLNNDIDLAALKELIMKNGGQAMVIANINHVGTQQLQYAGRSSTLVNAQLDIDTYDIKTGDSIGNGYGTNLNYTSLNATDEASDAVMQYSGELTENLKSKI
jgi:hypothetical protein